MPLTPGGILNQAFVPLPKSVRIVPQSRDINRTVLSRVGNYRLLLQRQLRTEAEDHVEDPRVRNTNCNYGRACAHDILHPWSPPPPSPLSLLYAPFILPFSLSLSSSLILFLSSAASARETYGGTYERVFITHVYAHHSAARTWSLGHLSLSWQEDEDGEHRN